MCARTYNMFLERSDTSEDFSVMSIGELELSVDFPAGFPAFIEQCGRSSVAEKRLGLLASSFLLLLFKKRDGAENLGCSACNGNGFLGNGGSPVCSWPVIQAERPHSLNRARTHWRLVLTGGRKHGVRSRRQACWPPSVELLSGAFSPSPGECLGPLQLYEFKRENRPVLRLLGIREVSSSGPAKFQHSLCEA